MHPWLKYNGVQKGTVPGGDLDLYTVLAGAAKGATFAVPQGASPGAVLQHFAEVERRYRDMIPDEKIPAGRHWLADC